MAQEPSSQAEHFNVDCDSTDQNLVEEVAGLDFDIKEAESITRFLTLPTVNKSKFTDPILDFTESHILICDEFTNSMQRLHESRENAVKEKERKAIEREESKKQKANEREEARVAKVSAREEACLKELWRRYKLKSRRGK